jgi:hypothetical protein
MRAAWTRLLTASTEVCMRNAIALFFLLVILLGATVAIARGGRSDDCPPGSTDPDCVDTTKPPPSGK